MIPPVCAVCGGPIPPRPLGARGPRPQVCSAQCRERRRARTAERRAAALAAPLVPCAECGATISPRSPGHPGPQAAHCSKACRMRHRRRTRKSQRGAEPPPPSPAQSPEPEPGPCADYPPPPPPPTAYDRVGAGPVDLPPASRGDLRPGVRVVDVLDGQTGVVRPAGECPRGDSGPGWVHVLWDGWDGPYEPCCAGPGELAVTS